MHKTITLQISNLKKMKCGKEMFKFLFFLILFIETIPAIGCMEETSCGEHFVSCNCSCKETISEKGKCLQCGHSGNLNRGLITEKILVEENIAL